MLPLELQVTAAVLGIISTLAGLVTLLFIPVIRSWMQRRKALDNFLRDWQGEEAAPGRDRVPGVMERLNRLDGELKRNGGSTMKDAVDRIETSLTEVVDLQKKQSGQIAEWGTTVAKLTSRLDDVEKHLAEHDGYFKAHDEAAHKESEKTR